MSELNSLTHSHPHHLQAHNNDSGLPEDLLHATKSINISMNMNYT